MEEKKVIRVKCPNCGAILKLEVSPSADLSKGALTCKNCRIKSPWTRYIPVEEKPQQDETQVVSKLHDTIGHLVDEHTRKEYALKEGVQLIGRMTYQQPPKADVPIVTEDPYFSRTQFRLRVMKGRDGCYHTYIYEASRSNPTNLNGNKLEPGDEEGLNDGDIISAGNTRLRFVGSTVDDKTILSSLVNKQ